MELTHQLAQFAFPLNKVVHLAPGNRQAERENCSYNHCFWTKMHVFFRRRIAAFHIGLLGLINDARVTVTNGRSKQLIARGIKRPRRERYMKNYLVAFVLGLGLVGCTRSDRAEIKQETREAAEETRARTAEAGREANAKRREYQERMQARLDKIDREMEEERLKAKGRKMNAKARREYNEKMAELENERKEARANWEQLKDATDDKWEQFKDGLDRAADKMENGWNRFVADLKD